MRPTPCIAHAYNQYKQKLPILYTQLISAAIVNTFYELAQLNKSQPSVLQTKKERDREIKTKIKTKPKTENLKLKPKTYPKTHKVPLKCQ